MPKRIIKLLDAEMRAIGVNYKTTGHRRLAYPYFVGSVSAAGAREADLSKEYDVTLEGYSEDSGALAEELERLAEAFPAKEGRIAELEGARAVIYCLGMRSKPITADGVSRAEAELLVKVWSEKD